MVFSLVEDTEAMSRKLPFVGRIFWKVFVVVTVLVVAAWYLIPRFSEYKIEPQDYGGSAISAVIFAYLVHLWLLPDGEADREAALPMRSAGSSSDSGEAPGAEDSPVDGT